MLSSFLRQRMGGYIRQAELLGDMRRIWSNHVWQDREATIAIANNLPSTQSSVNFALTTPKILGELYSNFYNEQSVKRIEDTLTGHIKIAGDIVTAARDNNMQHLEELTKQWYANADDFARVMATTNPHYDENMVRKMMYEHLRLILLMVSQIVRQNYDAGVATFNLILTEAEEMADYFAKGIIAHLPERFR